MTTGLVAISIGDSEDLADLGYGPEHLDALNLRLARALLADGLRLAYGGVLNPREGQPLEQQKSFLRQLIDIVAEQAAPRTEAALVSYLPWPWHTSITVSLRAHYHGVIQFVPVDPPSGTCEREDQRYDWAMADACTAMRFRMTDGLDARVVLGGKRRGWAGTLPGIAEEVMLAVEAERPVFLLGGFGGCAGAIAGYLVGDSDALPEDLTLDGHRGSPRLGKVAACAPADTVEDAFARLAGVLRALRQDLGRLRNGLTAEENARLMRTENVRVILSLVRRGLRERGIVGS
jgi:hypothetical protein